MWEERLKPYMVTPAAPLWYALDDYVVYWKSPTTVSVAEMMNELPRRLAKVKLEETLKEVRSSNRPPPSLARLTLPFPVVQSKRQCKEEDVHPAVWSAVVDGYGSDAVARSKPLEAFYGRSEISFTVFDLLRADLTRPGLHQIRKLSRSILDDALGQSARRAQLHHQRRPFPSRHL